MKRFITFISILSFSYFALIIGLRVIWVVTTQNKTIHRKIDTSIHTIVIGASNGAFTWNDNIIKGSKNMCVCGISYQSSYYNLRIAKERCKYDIDTVIFCAGNPTMYYYTDRILNRYDRFIDSESYNAAYYYADFMKFHINNPIYYKTLFTHFSIGYFKDLNFGYDDNNRIIGQNEYCDDVFINNDVLIHIKTSNGFTSKYIYDNCKLQVHYFKMICQYCYDNKIKLILLFTPTYRIQHLVSDDGYKEFLKENTIGKVEIADYTDFEVPYDFRGDYEHLNFQGAKMFSEDIAKNGLKTISLEDYCKQPWKE